MVGTSTILHLSLIQGIGPRTGKRIIELAQEHQVDLYQVTLSDLAHWSVPASVASKLIEGFADIRLLDEEVARIEKYNISWTVFGQSDYPALLWHTYAPPLVLYWQGTATWNNSQTLSVVGSREGNLYGKRAIDALVVPCIEQGITIISGGARGIDTMAHEAALRYGGSTVVVLGSGLLKPYPTSNKKLFEQIIQHNGAVVSCFPLMAEALSWQFPIRNRIIAGMARGCLVIQAAEKSGALITASYALQEGRNVYAVPGHFDDPLSSGCHKLLQDGAQLVTSVDHILQDYITSQTVALVANKAEKPKIAQQSLFVPVVASQPREKTLADFCSKPIGLDQLLEVTGKDEDKLKDELFMLQLDGLIEQDFAGLWVRK